LLQYVDVSLNFLDNRAAFRLQLGHVSCTGSRVQLIARKEIFIVVALLVHFCAGKKNIVASQLYDVADV